MITISAHIVPTALSALLLVATLPAQTPSQPAPSTQVSKVRIVRLSEVRGAVELDRNTGRGFEPAMANLPIVEKSRLQTGVGVAEVEFEDNSTLRLAPDSVVEFPQLERLSTGITASSVHLVKGMAYVSMVKATKSNEFTLLVGQQKLELLPASHVRLQIDGSQAKFAVLDGTVRIDGPAGVTDVAKKKTVTFALQEQAPPTIAKNIAPDPLDSWDQNAAGYHAKTAEYAALASSPYAYGQNDMMNYGSFMNAEGCGSMWRPYFASASWEPYSNGAFAYYPSAGYSWVSPYPWGWTPYHSGTWAYCPSAGWGWQPGGTWNGLNNTAVIAAPSGGLHRLPGVPVHPPRVGESTISAVNLKPLVRSEAASDDSFVFRKDSAGMGVPRDGLGKLNKISEHALKSGSVSTNIYVSTPVATAGSGRSSAYANVVPVSVHIGLAPPGSSRGDSLADQRSVNSGNSRSSGPAPSAPARSAPRAR